MSKAVAMKLCFTVSDNQLPIENSRALKEILSIVSRGNSGGYRGAHELVGEGAFHYGESLVELGFGDYQWHENANDVAIRAGVQSEHTALVTILDDVFGRGVVGKARLGRAYQFDCLHATEAADFADLRPLRLPLLRASAEAFAKSVSTGGEIETSHGVDGGDGGFARDGIAAEGAADGAGAGSVHDLGAAGDRAER